jgi:hypothetical protein
MSISEGAHVDASMFDDPGTEEQLNDEAYVFAEARSNDQSDESEEFE